VTLRQAESVEGGDLVVARLGAARNALVEAKTATQVKAVMDAAAAAEIFARRQRLSEETIQHATAIKLDAERKLGGILREMPKSEGGRPPEKTGSEVEPVLSTPTLAELGIDKKTSMRAQKLADLPDETFEAVRLGEVKVNEALRQQRREELIERAIALPAGQYRVVYADPPWQYGDERTSLAGYSDSAAAAQYPTMPLADICAMDVKAMAAPDAVLFLWATFPLLPEGLEVVKAWGFTYKTAFVWDKQRANMGNYHNACAELLLVATRGSCTPEIDTRFPQVQAYGRARHSEKPEDWRRVIDGMYPSGPRIELFRRGDAPAGWVVWGNEAAA
jgi:N6-adenosine-specific RNA methylase IME4